MLTVRLSEDLEARLNNAAKELGVSKSAFTRDAIAHHMAKWEDELLSEAQSNEQNSSFQT